MTAIDLRTAMSNRPKLPDPHPQWAALDFAEALAYPSLLLVIGQSNSLLSQSGAQAHERLWERTRRPGGVMPNTLELVAAARAAGQRVAWTRYEIFRQDYPQSLVDQAQYGHWMKGREDWTAEEIARDADTVDDIKAVMRPEDVTVYYTSLGNVFLGTMLPQHLAAWGVRTVVLAGHHLDWCIEQAARTARDIGYSPIVVGDAVCAGRESDEAPTLERLDTFFAPVISTERALKYFAEGAKRRDERGWPT